MKKSESDASACFTTALVQRMAAEAFQLNSMDAKHHKAHKLGLHAACGHARQPSFNRRTDSQ